MFQVSASQMRGAGVGPDLHQPPPPWEILQEWQHVSCSRVVLKRDTRRALFLSCEKGSGWLSHYFPGLREVVGVCMHVYECVCVCVCSLLGTWVSQCVGVSLWEHKRIYAILVHAEEMNSVSGAWRGRWPPGWVTSVAPLKWALGGPQEQWERTGGTEAHATHISPQPHVQGPVSENGSRYVSLALSLCEYRNFRTIERTWI